MLTVYETVAFGAAMLAIHIIIEHFVKVVWKPIVKKALELASDLIKRIRGK